MLWTAKPTSSLTCSSPTRCPHAETGKRSDARRLLARRNPRRLSLPPRERRLEPGDLPDPRRMQFGATDQVEVAFVDFAKFFAHQDDANAGGVDEAEAAKINLDLHRAVRAQLCDCCLDCGRSRHV